MHTKSKIPIIIDHHARLAYRGTSFQINDTLKDRVDDSERGKLDAEHLVDLLKTEKQDLITQKTELFNVSPHFFLLITNYWAFSFCLETVDRPNPVI